MLNALGINKNAEAVYRLMLTRQDWGVAEIAAEVGTTESEVHDALDRLAELRLLRRSLESPGQLLPVTPAVAFQALLQHQQAELMQRQQEFVQTQAAITELTAEYTNICCTASTCEGDRIDGLDAIQDRLEALAGRATSECLSFMPGGAQSTRSLEASKPLDQAMLERGVRVLTVYLDSVRNDSPTLNYARWLTQLGGEVRTVPSLPLRTVIFDRDIAMVPVDPENSRSGAVQLSGAGVMAAMNALFDQVWATATPLGLGQQRTEEGPTPQEREILSLLAQGFTDEVVGKRLCLGVRTVRRMMADISERLEARSRFEIGVKACTRGWLRP